MAERYSRKQWSECYGIDLERVDKKTADTYLKSADLFFGKFDGGYASALGKQCAVDVKQCMLEDIRAQFNYAAARLCKSPIEQEMLAGLIWTKFGPEHRSVEIWDWQTVSEKPSTDVVIALQYQVQKYFVDFALFIKGVVGQEIRIAVECDGNDFHEKTRDQAARDKSRRRAIEIAGWKMLPFTGSEIWKDHRGCADEVSRLAMNEIASQLGRLGLPNLS